MRLFIQMEMIPTTELLKRALSVDVLEERHGDPMTPVTLTCEGRTWKYMPLEKGGAYLICEDGMPLPLHVICRDLDDARFVVESSTKRIGDGKAPLRGVFRLALEPLTKGQPGMVLAPSKTNPAVKRWQKVEQAAAAARPDDPASVARLHEALVRHDPHVAQAAIRHSLHAMGEMKHPDEDDAPAGYAIHAAPKRQARMIASDPSGWHEVLTGAVRHRDAAERTAARWKGEHQEEARAADRDAAYEHRAAEEPSKAGRHGGHVWMYHGTTDKFLDTIRREGLTTGHAPSNFGSKSSPNKRQQHVYLTTDAGHGPAGAGDYARKAAARHGGNPVVLRVRVPASRLTHDADDADLSVGAHQRRASHVEPHEIMEVNGDRTEHGDRLHRGDDLTKAAPGLVLAPSDANPHVKRWKRISSAHGTTFTTPLHGRDETWRVGPSSHPGHVQMLRSSYGFESGPHIPAESVEHFHDDLNGVLRASPTSGNPHVDAVLSGHGERVGKGHDGIVYTHRDHAVKVSTTVPFHPDNSFHRTPVAAVAHLAGETAAHEQFADLPAIPKATGVDHEGRHYLVKPRLSFGETYTAEELKPVFDTVRGMHARGFVVGDDMQVGRASDGKVYLSDLGQVRPIEHRTHQRDDERDDLEKLDRLYREHGQQMPIDAGIAEMAYRGSVEGMVAMWRAIVKRSPTPENRDRLAQAVDRSGVHKHMRALQDIHQASGNMKALGDLEREHNELLQDMRGGPVESTTT